MLSAHVAVSTISDVGDGDTSSLAALTSAPGSDGVISLREANAAANNTASANTIGFTGDVLVGDGTLGSGLTIGQFQIVPEPAGLAVLGLGGLLLLGRRR